MQNCRKCNKRYTVTSWTRSRKWRSYCPTCIVDGMEALMASLKGEERDKWNLPE